MFDDSVVLVHIAEIDKNVLTDFLSFICFF